MTIKSSTNIEIQKRLQSQIGAENPKTVSARTVSTLAIRDPIRLRPMRSHTALKYEEKCTVDRHLAENNIFPCALEIFDVFFYYFSIGVLINVFFSPGFTRNLSFG